MNNFRLPAARLLLVLLACSALVSNIRVAAAQDHSSGQTLKETLDQIIAAAGKGDDATLAKYQSKQMTVMDAQGFTRGADSYTAKVRSVNAQHAQLKDFRTRDVAVHESGNMGWATYIYRLKAPSGDGHYQNIYGQATIIFQKVKGQWQIVHSQTTGRSEKTEDPQF